MSLILSPYEISHLAINVFGAMQKQEEFVALLTAVDILGPRTILEIGVGMGGASWALSKIGFLEKHICIDLPEGPWGGATQEAGKKTFEYISSFGQGELTFISGSSHNSECLESVKFSLGDKQIDFLFIDGDHSYEGVKTDFLTYSPLVRKGGLIAFHDICEHDPSSGCEVKKFWDEIKSSGIPEDQYSEFIQEPVNWGGVGLIRW